MITFLSKTLCLHHVGCFKAKHVFDVQQDHSAEWVSLGKNKSNTKCPALLGELSVSVHDYSIKHKLPLKDWTEKPLIVQSFNIWSLHVCTMFCSYVVQWNQLHVNCCWQFASLFSIFPAFTHNAKWGGDYCGINTGLTLNSELQVWLFKIK